MAPENRKTEKWGLFMSVDFANYLIALLFCVCYSYQFIYLLVPFFVRRPKKPSVPLLHRYAVLISARNEEAVLPNLIFSIRNQTYPADLVSIFVCADNCTDRTAEVAEEAGAVVFERFDKRHIGKGYALRYLLESVNRDFGEKTFDAFFVFDADNVLEPDYIERMNETFCEGYNIVTGYRNSKNYGDNWISAGYSLWFLRESQYLNRSRYLLGTSAGVSGTGFMFSRGVVERAGGWKYFLLTEDIEFTIDSVIAGEKIGYCERAVLYDEQPTDFKQSVRQRLRWARGYIQVFCAYGGGLVRGIFSKNFFSCYDMTMNILPSIILSVASVILNLSTLIFNAADPSAWASVGLSLAQSLLNVYLTFIIIGLVTLITERRKIHAPARKKVLYLFSFPLFMLTYIPISVAALFINVEWKPIVHRRSRTLAEIKRD